MCSEVHVLATDPRHASTKSELGQPGAHSLTGPREFGIKPTAPDDKPNPAVIDGLPESTTRIGARGFPQLADDVDIDDRTHRSEGDGALDLLQEELSIPRRSTADVAESVDRNRMQSDIETAALEVNNRHVIWREPARSVCHCHANSVDDEVTVRLDDYLSPTPASFNAHELAHQAAQRCLGYRMQMYLWLLQQEGLGPARPQEFRDNRQHLTDAVAHVDEIPEPTRGAVAELAYLDLERVRLMLAVTPNLQLVEQFGRSAKCLQLSFQRVPFSWRSCLQLRQISGDRISDRVGRDAHGVVCAPWLRANRRTRKGPLSMGVVHGSPNAPPQRQGLLQLGDYVLCQLGCVSDRMDRPTAGTWANSIGSCK